MPNATKIHDRYHVPIPNALGIAAGRYGQVEKRQ